MKIAKLFIPILALLFVSLSILPVSAQNLQFNGDFCYRIQTDNVPVDTTQNSIRLRIGTDLQVNDKTDVLVRLNTNNQTLDNNGAFKNIALDVARVKYQATNNISISMGKMLNPFYKPGGSELLWDDDYNPEGAALQVKTDCNGIKYFATSAYSILDENMNAEDIIMHGIQGGVSIDVSGNMQLVLGGGYYDYRGTDFQNVEAFVELSTKVNSIKGSVYGDYSVKNGEDNVNSYLTGVKIKINKLSLNYNYRDVEQTALTTDVDFGANIKGHKAIIGYNILSNVEARASYLEAIDNNPAVPNNKTYRFDLIVRF